MKAKISVLILLALFISNLSFAQKSLDTTLGSVKMSYFTGSSYSYNFFTGRDANLFQTTPKALGSGLYDFSTTIPINIWLYSPKRHAIGFGTGVGLSFRKYRFVKPYYFDTQQDKLVVDTVSTHIYRQDFFTRDGSKFTFMNLFVPAIVYLPVSKWIGNEDMNFGLMFMGFYKRNLYVHNKLFYQENGLLVKNKYTNDAINKYFNKDNYGVRTGFKFYVFYLWGEYTFSPFFNKYYVNYDVHETRVGFTIDFTSIIYKRLKNKLGEDDDNSTDL